jgi:ribokinase
LGVGGSGVAIIGSMNADYTVEVDAMPQPGETITSGPMVIHPGGKSANQAASSARLGAVTTMLGAVGSDSNADFLVGRLAGAGVDVSAIEHVPGASGSTVIVVDSTGENFVIVAAGSNGEVTPEYAGRHAGVLRDAVVLGLCLETPVDTVTAAAELAVEGNTLVVLNISPLPDSVPEELIAATDIVMMNEHEVADFLGLGEALTLESDWDAVQKRLVGRGFERAVVTLGAAGSVVLDYDAATFDILEPVHVPAYTVTPVDTTGAGDSFMGAVLAGLTAGLGLVDACSVASAVSAYSTLGKGAQSSYGSSEQILEFVKKS